jgi:hypothetical protein
MTSVCLALAVGDVLPEAVCPLEIEEAMDQDGFSIIRISSNIYFHFISGTSVACVLHRWEESGFSFIVSLSHFHVKYITYAAGPQTVFA